MERGEEGYGYICRIIPVKYMKYVFFTLMVFSKKSHQSHKQVDSMEKF